MEMESTDGLLMFLFHAGLMPLSTLLTALVTCLRAKKMHVMRDTRDIRRKGYI
jgi:hypothetical protein